MPVDIPSVRTCFHFSASGTPRIEPSWTKISLAQAGPQSFALDSVSSTVTFTGTPPSVPSQASNEHGPGAAPFAVATRMIAAASTFPSGDVGSSRILTARANSWFENVFGKNCGKQSCRTSFELYAIIASRSTPRPRFMTGTPIPYSERAEGEYIPKVATSTHPWTG